MKIGNVKLKSDIILAPMAGFTDVGFRRLASQYGAGLTVTEMVSAKGLCFGNKNTSILLETSNEESPVAVQIFGSEPEFIAKAVKHQLIKKFDIIDINMGCPVPKIIKNGEGSAILKDIGKVYEIIRAGVENTDIPITVKIRLGFDENSINAVNIAKTAEKAGASAITVHGRTREQMYSGKADWNKIKEVKAKVTIPVIANGDIATYIDYIKVKEITNCDGVMVGRGALGKPFIFSEMQLKEFEFVPKVAITQHIADLLKVLPPKTVTNIMKQHICFYAKNTDKLKAIRTEVNRATCIENLTNIIDIYF